MPTILEALNDLPITELVAALRHIASGRSEFLDRKLRWDLIREIIAFLPDAPKRALSAWSGVPTTSLRGTTLSVSRRCGTSVT
ncbi:MAG: hypothetical protein WBP81_26295 [Solirubrobacteraceae bacterium]